MNRFFAGPLLPSKEMLESQLLKGASELGLTLGDVEIKQLLTYLALLSRWNKVYNLTAIRSLEEMLVQHVLDSMTVLPSLENVNKIVDVGAGAGLPGMVIAVLRPQMHVTLIDTVQKKTAFLSQVKAELNLKNVMVYTGRVEKLYIPNDFDAVISRAFSDLSTFVDLTQHLVSEDGRFYAMKGVIPEGEIARLPAGLTVEAVIPLKVPFLDAERHLVVLKKEANKS